MAGDDAMMNAAELFPKKVDDDGFDTLGVGDVDTVQQLDGVFPDTGATLETTWNQTSTCGATAPSRPARFPTPSEAR